MTATFLQNIFELKKQRVEAQKGIVDLAELKEKAFSVRSISKPHRLLEALQNTAQVNIIAEIKRASPSKGIINDGVDVAAVVKSYERGGACAISVLTEEDFFRGSLDDLRRAREAVDLPILRKDFMFDEYQIYEAAEAGADVILLIAAMLDDKVLDELCRLAETDLGMDALIEVHTLKELKRVNTLGAKIIGVNNRDLHSFDVSLDVSRDLIKHASGEALMITESGLQSLDEILELHKLGFSGFLIGETLMKSRDAEEELRKLTTVTKELTEIY